MPGKRVAVLDPNGQFGTVDETDLENLPDGARVLTAQEVKSRELDEAYDKSSTAQKALGHAGAALGPVASSTLTGLGAAAVDPRVAAFEREEKNVATLGFDEPIIKGAMSSGAGKAYGARVTAPGQAHPEWATAGQVTGMAAMALGGSGLSGAARAIPGAGVAALGGVAESAAARALGGLATKGVLGRMAATSAQLAVRGAVEGAAYAGAQQAVEDKLLDQPITGAKIWSAIGHGALAGAAIGGGLGATGSLAASGARGVAKLARGAARAERAAVDPWANVRGLVEPDAGLRGGPEPIEKPFKIGSTEQRPVQLRPDVGQRGAVAAEDVVRFPKDKPLTIENLFTAEAERTPLRVDPDAGINPLKRGTGGRFEVQGPIEATDALRLSSAKNVARNVEFHPTQVSGAAEAAEAIRLPGAASSTDPVRGLAADQAWKAVGAGFGLQTTRYAKEAARYFPNGTRDLGEVALRYGVIDVPQNASPWAAAWQAARSGTPDAIAPKITSAEADVGSKIGAITDSSGARISRADVDAAINRVRGEYNRYAGNEHVVSAIDTYANSLRSKLGNGKDVRIQDLLEQRKGLDEIVYQETKQLDPARRVKALREVRGELEDVITKSLDDASGRAPGELKAQYKSLKRDYHALRILREAAEDSAARASKGSTFGLMEKASLALSLATGDATGAAMALGGKLVRERGNAAAAAFLSRAADRGTFSKLISSVDMRVANAARNVLSEANETARPKTSGRAKMLTPATVASSRESLRQTQADAQRVVQWVAMQRANPQRFMDSLVDSAGNVSRTAGPQAAAAYTESALRSLTYLSSYVPAKERRDPLDPRSVPPLTIDESVSLLRAAKYTTQPMSVWDDFGRGVITPEGLRAANELHPELFANFQSDLLSHATEQVLRNKRLSQSKRLRLDKLLGIPGGADLRGESILRSQANFAEAPRDDAGPKPDATGAPVNMKVQQSGFDAVEARLAS